MQSCAGAFDEAENDSLAQGFWIFQFLNRTSTFYDVYNVFIGILEVIFALSAQIAIGLSF